MDAEGRRRRAQRLANQQREHEAIERLRRQDELDSQERQLQFEERRARADHHRRMELAELELDAQRQQREPSTMRSRSRYRPESSSPLHHSHRPEYRAHSMPPAAGQPINIYNNTGPSHPSWGINPYGDNMYAAQPPPPTRAYHGATGPYVYPPHNGFSPGHPGSAGVQPFAREHEYEDRRSRSSRSRSARRSDRGGRAGRSSSSRARSSNTAAGVAHLKKLFRGESIMVGEQDGRFFVQSVRDVYVDSRSSSLDTRARSRSTSGQPTSTRATSIASSRHRSPKPAPTQSRATSVASSEPQVPYKVKQSQPLVDPQMSHLGPSGWRSR